METEVIMKRVLFDTEISQKSKSEYFSATELVRAGNAWRIAKKLEPFHLDRWLQTKHVKEFIRSLEDKVKKKVIISGRGRGKHTWVHPYIFIDIALAISPTLKVEVYGWLYDYLLKYRNDSGDSYKIMSGALYDNSTCKSTFQKEISIYAEEIKKACDVIDWQKATQEQLELRDRIHNSIATLSDIIKDNNQVVRLGIVSAVKTIEKIKGGEK